jgi:SPP1 family predicted phage head-tail adaptor
MSLSAGKLNRRITLQRRTKAQDSTGQEVDEWTDVVRVWAWVKTQSGMSATRQSSVVDGVAMSLNSYSFRVRYRPGVTDDMRVAYQGVFFDIKQVRHDIAGHIWTDIVCEQGGNDG